MMNKNVIVGILLLATLSTLPLGAENSWGRLKKIRFFCDQKKDAEAIRLLPGLTGGDLPREERREMVDRIVSLADLFLHKKNYKLSEALYVQALKINPDAWFIYSKLEILRRAKGNYIPGFINIWRQIKLFVSEFSSTFLMLTGSVTFIFYSGLIVFFFFSLFIYWKYFALVSNDFLQAKKKGTVIPQLVIALVFFIWPLAFGGGWGVYPFLITAFFWIYMDSTERKISRRMMAILLLFSILFGFGKWLERHAGEKDFAFYKAVYEGDLRNRKFPDQIKDPDLQVFYAYYLYERGKVDEALDRILRLPSSYNRTIKKDLMGIIQYKKGNVDASLQNFRESLEVNDKNRVTLRNLTLALLKNEDPKKFSDYFQRFPEIGEMRDSVQRDRYAEDIMRMQFPRDWLWIKLLKMDSDRIEWISLLKSVLLEIIRIPVFLYLLIFLISRLFVRRMFSFLGVSEYCSKCSKIIKRKMIEHYHILCEDCYQLFMVKDPVFYDAKIIKEREISRRVRRKSLSYYLFSLVIPGFSLNFYDKSRTFIFYSWLFFFTGGFSLYFVRLFRSYFGVAPVPLFFLGIAAIVCYLLVGLYSLKGWDNGF